MEKVKPGWRSTEFILTCVGVIGGVLMSLFEEPGSNVSTIIGALLVAVCGGSYSVGRSLVKASTERANGFRASRDANATLLEGLRKAGKSGEAQEE